MAISTFPTQENAFQLSAKLGGSGHHSTRALRFFRGIGYW